MIIEATYSPRTAGLGVSFSLGAKWYHVAVGIELGPVMLSIGPFPSNRCRAGHDYCAACFKCERCGESQIND